MEEQEESQVEATEVDNTEAEHLEARKMGWVPVEDFKGDPAKHRSAKDFLEFGEKLAPILKKQRDEYRTELDDLKRQFAGYKETAAALIKQNVEKATKEKEDTITFLKQQIRMARKSGDHDTVDALEDQIEEVKARKVEEVQVPRVEQPAEDPVVNAWRADNPWFDSDPVLGKYTIGVAQDLRAKGEKRQGRAFYDLLAEEVRSAFPEKFAKRRTTVESATPGAQSRQASKGYSSLPADAKKACDKFVDNKFGSREEYVEMYFAEA